jgi:hypothetical protein
MPSAMAFTVILMRIITSGPTSTAGITELDVGLVWDFKIFAFMETS